jgi:hypothetical protein
MPLPKALRRTARASPSTGLAQRKRCRSCNNLDPRGHGSSAYASEAAKEPTASLDLVLDALMLARTRSTDCGGCRFCNVLVQTLDAFFKRWRGVRCRVNVHLKEKGTIKVSIDDERWKREVVEIYAASGRSSFFQILFSTNFFRDAAPAVVGPRVESRSSLSWCLISAVGKNLRKEHSEQHTILRQYLMTASIARSVANARFCP